MERIRVATAVFCVVLLLQIIRAVRREHIRVEYSMAWFGAAALLLVLSFSESLLDWLSRTLGIDDPSLVLVLIAGLLFLFTFFHASVQISDLKDNNIVLAQKVGILEWEVKRQASEIDGLQSARRQRREAPGETRERRL